MTYFDIKVAVFAIKIANCKNSTRYRRSACRVGRLYFWKILAGEGAFTEATESSRLANFPESPCEHGARNSPSGGEGGGGAGYFSASPIAFSTSSSMTK